MDNTALYQERFDRIKKAINLETVNQVPMIFMGTAFAPRHVGISIAKFCKSVNAAIKSYYQTMDDYGFDGANMAVAGGSPLFFTLE